ncbi:immunoglobulin I-set domain protein [Ancylostoma duodenale]|uniref:Immunoglobulin I-set domain protein n=1 Tax=Ancylostoma duodenale TaxID=51022 RepID=A0A0C2GVI2_9BILA|nr:immunoglobulin I-set domain protein [Ancylostoma duodenale]
MESVLSADKNSEEACAPSFLQKRQTVKCTEAKSLAINVFLVASPQPVISVYHNNDHVICANQVEPVDTPEHNLYSFTFAIDRVRFEDGGKLMFKAENMHGFDECTAYLEIAEEVKPSNSPKFMFFFSFYYVIGCIFRVLQIRYKHAIRARV